MFLLKPCFHAWEQIMPFVLHFPLWLFNYNACSNCSNTIWVIVEMAISWFLKFCKAHFNVSKLCQLFSLNCEEFKKGWCQMVHIALIIWSWSIKWKNYSIFFNHKESLNCLSQILCSQQACKFSWWFVENISLAFGEKNFKSFVWKLIAFNIINLFGLISMKLIVLACVLLNDFALAAVFTWCNCLFQLQELPIIDQNRVRDIPLRDDGETSPWPFRSRKWINQARRDVTFRFTNSLHRKMTGYYSSKWLLQTTEKCCNAV